MTTATPKKKDELDPRVALADYEHAICEVRIYHIATFVFLALSLFIGLDFYQYNMWGPELLVPVVLFGAFLLFGNEWRKAEVKGDKHNQTLRRELQQLRVALQIAQMRGQEAEGNNNKALAQAEKVRADLAQLGATYWGTVSGYEQQITHLRRDRTIVSATAICVTILLLVLSAWKLGRSR